MRKPVSKHALRRAMEQARAEGLLAWDQPAGAVVDHVWHLLSRDALEAPRERRPERRREPVAA